MQFRGVPRLQRALLALSQMSKCQCTVSMNFQALKRENQPVYPRRFHTTPFAFEKEVAVKYTSPQNIGILHKILFKLGVKNSRLIAIAYLTYGMLVDKIIDYEVFYKEIGMADTMFSWFLVTELYVWMVMVRYMGEGNDGLLLRDALTRAMWEDIQLRVDKLGRIKRKIKNRQLLELNAQFNAAIIAYDEGLLTNDKVLADALWRRIMQSNCNNAEVLEKLVVFIRKQIQLLDSIPTPELLSRPRLRWIDYKTVKPFQ